MPISDEDVKTITNKFQDLKIAYQEISHTGWGYYHDHVVDEQDGQGKKEIWLAMTGIVGGYTMGEAGLRWKET